MACAILIPQLEIEPVPLQWKHRALTTGPPGKSLPLKIYLLKQLDYFSCGLSHILNFIACILMA